jgi:prepilin-type N-terminal cleavage/methylation domain-containing protein
MKKLRGFTLYELMITLAVVGVVASFAVPSMQYSIEKRNTVDVAEEIYSQIHLARSEAIARSQPVFMNIVPGTNWAIGISTDAACDPSDNNPACTLPDLDTNNPITHLITAADHPDFTLTSTSNQITFESQRGTTSGATIDVESTEDNGFEVTVAVGLLGQVSVCSAENDPDTAYVSGYRAC